MWLQKVGNRWIFIWCWKAPRIGIIHKHNDIMRAPTTFHKKRVAIYVSMLSDWLVWINRLDMVHVPSMKQCHLSGSRKFASSITATALWNEILLEIHVFPILKMFRRPSKIWLFSQAWVRVDGDPCWMCFCECFYWMTRTYLFLLCREPSRIGLELGSTET